MKASFSFATSFALSALAAGLVISAAPAAEPAVPASPNGATVLVAKATNACFSDMVRVTGFIVPRREALVGVETEGSKVSEVLVREGDTVAENQELARLTPPSAPGAARPGPVTLRAPAAGLITSVNTIAGAPASAQAGPMFRIAIGGDIELDAEVPSIHILKLNSGATARISRDDQSDVPGKVRLVSPQIDRATQLGHVRLAFASNPGLKVGMFARAAIDAKRSCGVSIPRSAIDHLTVQLVKGNTIETRRVKVGLTSDTSMEILEGVDADDVVVADAGTSLHDGDQVKTIFAEDIDRSRVR
ncbi:MAG: efflux transporter periplasmic adaptor subunit [Tardiphaga sp.]|jgi:multidrug efflux pump subunit AcrA (membrane-fusion protein)|uniref:efflux RND transporter periplasmic adaptor subunit n=1 Tax=Tardiphaga sp. TaxID=1926292 RepID=UPI002636EA62|nr:efflux RND transporter periplasmic adaptor subunit [Tardiphaga sp.]MDB5500677.1 efflux transporter periplasmic adaptor subunit [Tardiphaga sp.]